MKLVPFARARRRPDPARLQEFAGMARKLQQEREAAAELLRDTPRAEWPSLAELRTVGAVEQLAREVEARLDREPREALAIAELATVLAESLPAGEYPAVVLTQTRALAWKDRGQALCYLARHEEALEALDRAEAMLEAVGTLAHDLAIVRFVRATTLQEVNRFDESMQLLAECRVVFRAHGDARRWLLCGIAEGAQLYRMKRFREAREAYTALLPIARELGDPNAEASLHHNIGHTSIEISDFTGAEMHLATAIELFTTMGAVLNAARAEAVRGVLFARRGEYHRAVRHMGAVRRLFLQHGLVEEAGLFGLEIVQAHLSLGEYDAAESLAREIVEEFTGAHLNTRAIVALGHLTEAIAARRASTALIGGVRDFIVSLRKHPEREFTACA